MRTLVMWTIKESKFQGGDEEINLTERKGRIEVSVLK